MSVQDIILDVGGSTSNIPYKSVMTTTTARWMSIAYDNNKFYAIGLDTGKF